MQKRVSFKNTKGQQLVGVLHIPKGKGPFPAVIVQHGLFGNHHHPLIKAIAIKLEKAGFIVLRFSWSGHNPSQGTYKEIMASQFVKDVKKGLEFLKRQPKVNIHRIGIIGHSLGAFISLIFAGISSDFRATVSISSFVDAYKQLHILYKRGVAERYKGHLVIWGHKVPRNHYQDRALWKVDKKISDIHCPLLIIHGNKDKTTRVSDAREIYQLTNKPKELRVIKGADHNFTNKKHRQKVVNSTVSWCQQYLAFKKSKVVNALIQYQDKILLVKRSQKVGTHPGYWSGVGGYMDKGESAIATAQREVSEELKIQKAKFKNYYLGRMFKLDNRAIDRIWLVHPVLFRLKGKPQVKLDWENSEYRWVKLSDVQRYKVIPTMPRALKELGLINK